MPDLSHRIQRLPAHPFSLRTQFLLPPFIFSRNWFRDNSQPVIAAAPEKVIMHDSMKSEHKFSLFYSFGSGQK
jgi:hypothetical protein